MTRPKKQKKKKIENHDFLTQKSKIKKILKNIFLTNLGGSFAYISFLHNAFGAVRKVGKDEISGDSSRFFFFNGSSRFFFLELQSVFFFPVGFFFSYRHMGLGDQKSKNVEMCVLVIEVGFTPEKGGCTPL